MSFQASFKQILREKMTEPQEFSQQKTDINLHSDPAHLAYLLGQINRFERQVPRKHYPTTPLRPQRKAHNLNPAQRLSYEFFKTWNHDLSEGFTPQELKKAFRRTAILLHPDHGGSAQQFVELKHHYEILRCLTP